ncbi:MAG: hypothetical protein NTV80_05910 [Verrucomicrobia bacterium]|nr:hypothetical protein [Verrucomicrobiota bacterium]
MTIKYNTRIWILLSAVVLLFAALAVMDFARGPRSFIFGFKYGMDTRYEKISEGDSKRSVFDALGEPRTKSDVFNLPQRHGFEHLFDVAEKSSAVEYYQWINGMNWYYCIGFDASGAVVIKGQGHS